MNVWIYSGVPGSGKSTAIKNLHPKGTIFSSDDYYCQEGKYNYVAELIGEAHGWNLRNFIDYVSKTKTGEAVVDNTNTSIVEMAPYVAIAQAYGHKVKVVTLLCDPKKAWERNVHGVPLTTVMAMHEKLANMEIPPWWDHAVIMSEHL